MHNKSVTALIVDDEAPMRDQLRLRLRDAWPDLNILGEATNGIEAVEMAGALKPDIVFLDIRMPGQSGIEAARHLYESCHIVFVTAYDQYALDAFEQGAMDYLLKPVSPDRLKRTCDRLRARLTQAPQDIGAQLEQLTRVLQQGSSPAKPPEYLRWIQAQVGSSLRMVSTREILFFRSDEKYTCVQTDKFEALIRKPVRDLAEELDPSLFWQIHRATLVNVNAIEGVTRDIRGRHLVQIKGRADKLEVSRSFLHLFKQM